MNLRPLVIAHRGASGYRPEHTRSAYLLAFELGADAVEPDIVATSDGVLVLRHENEISGTTDVAAHPEFAARKTTRVIDGEKLSGWFTEDFTWAELSTLHAVERLPKIRPNNGTFEPEGLLRLTDLLDLIDGAARPITVVAEIKHATYFASIGLPLDELFAAEIHAAGWADDPRLVVECFEKTVLLQIRERGIPAPIVFLVDAAGGPADDLSRDYASYLTDPGLRALAGDVDGISLDKQILLERPDVVERAHSAGLEVFCWTLRAENRFLAKRNRNGSADAVHGEWLREYQQIMRLGVDGVFADQPDLAIEARATL